MATRSDGNYQFCNLPPGDYYVQFTLPPDYQLSPKEPATRETAMSIRRPDTYLGER